jgi:hypothetical protein
MRVSLATVFWLGREILTKRGVLMKRLVSGLLTILGILATAGVGVDAAPIANRTEEIGPYEGTFEGIAYGDLGSRAPLSLDLTHRGDDVEGVVRLGEGLYVNGGWCGAVDVPATTQHVDGQTVGGDPRRLVVNPTFDVGGFDLEVDFESKVSADGEVITARAKVDLPWFCGRDPALRATLYRD